MKAAWLALGIAVLALVAWFALRPAPAFAPARDDATAAALARIEQAQARQEERLARLEGRVAPGRAAPPRPGELPGDGRAANRVAGNGAMPDPAQALVIQQSQVRVLEDRLVSEAPDPAWATRQERAVDAFLAPASLRSEGLPAPSARDTRCQARMCRIRLRYPDEATAVAVQASLLMAIAPGLPDAQSFLLPQPDGSVELLVFAGSDAAAVR
jgi:hypothetical protein